MKTRIPAYIMAVSASLCLLLTACGPQKTNPSSFPAQGTETTAATAEDPQAPETTQPSTAPVQSNPTNLVSDSTQPGADPTQPATNPTESDTPTEPTDTPPAASGNGEKIASLAESLVGTTYLYGAAGPTEFDNSGLVYYCLTQNGISAPRRTGDLATAGSSVDKNDLQRGDIVFFHNDTPGVPQYVGIYIGNNQFVACNNEESPTKVQNMSLPYFVEHYVTARRFA